MRRMFAVAAWSCPAATRDPSFFLPRRRCELAPDPGQRRGLDLRVPALLQVDGRVLAGRPLCSLQLPVHRSGGGIAQIIAKTIDFGATDAPMSDEELAKATAPLLHLPTALGAVVVTYNLPGSPTLKLTSEAVAKIFLGKITNWQRWRDRGHQSGCVGCPNTPIAVVHRSDAQRHQLCLYGLPGKGEPGVGQGRAHVGKSVHWPAGTGAKRATKASPVKSPSCPGAIGYVELAYAFQNRCRWPSIKNRDGKFVSPSVASVTAAAGGDSQRHARPTCGSRSPTPMVPGVGRSRRSPTSSSTSDQTDASHGPTLVKFLRWGNHEGQALAEPLLYAPLPATRSRRWSTRSSRFSDAERRENLTSASFGRAQKPLGLASRPRGFVSALARRAIEVARPATKGLRSGSLKSSGQPRGDFGRVSKSSASREATSVRSPSRPTSRRATWVSGPSISGEPTGARRPAWEDVPTSKRSIPVAGRQTSVARQRVQVPYPDLSEAGQDALVARLDSLEAGLSR